MKIHHQCNNNSSNLLSKIEVFLDKMIDHNSNIKIRQDVRQIIVREKKQCSNTDKNRHCTTIIVRSTNCHCIVVQQMLKAYQKHAMHWSQLVTGDMQVCFCLQLWLNSYISLLFRDIFMMLITKIFGKNRPKI